MNDAPNFVDDYPLAGRNIGPAWRAAWTALNLAPDTELHSDHLVETMRSAAPITDKTARNLLRQARKHGLLQVTRRRVPDRHHPATSYRLATHPTGAKS